MSWEQTKVKSFSQESTSANDQTISFNHKLIEIYYYIDPLCSKSWSLEPYLKKLSLQYGHYFTIRPIITTHMTVTNKTYLNPMNLNYSNQRNNHQLRDKQLMQKENNFNHTLSPWTIALAIKAAEFQGKSAGRLFLRKVQQALFLKDTHFSDVSFLLRCARLAHLDMDEFKKDLNSKMAKKALQCDLNLAHEMNVQYAPTIVFFNSLLDEEGIKVSGLHSYHIYTHVLIKILKEQPIPDDLPPLEKFIATSEVVTADEISIIYDWPLKKAENELKKLKLRRIVEKKDNQLCAFWSHIK